LFEKNENQVKNRFGRPVRTYFGHLFELKSVQTGVRTSKDVYRCEDFPCESKDQLTAREAHFIRSLKCVNKFVPGRTDKEYREDTKDKISTRMKDYRDKNRDMINEKTECSCGGKYTRSHKALHFKTSKHQAYIKNSKVVEV